eukprot:TRINITY_DN27421_c0_g1_i1.p1 TRINITY_DN27421_c0_g1~~TRINITY_DN27421_c0_g1_i1.p1  ORF type:complete len:748 (+),score=119.46 TRINITY_DN27421_c0_g1_i1:83-2245(+)
MAKVSILQKEGNECFARGDYREAVSKYAAALAAGGQNLDAEVAAALRANRSLCCLKLGQNEAALAEAEQSRELRPDWAKAQFRVACALEAMGRLGDARLAACYARRLAPANKEIGNLVESLRAKIFGGPAERLGIALDTLEIFDSTPEVTRAAAVEVSTLVGPESAAEVGGDCDGIREACIRAFIAGGGAATVFRRQNAMGANWMEECKNGTMSLLSNIVAAAPRLEEELVRLSHEAEARERKNACADGAPGCKDRLPGKVAQPPPAATRRRRKRGARPLSAACDLFDGEFINADSSKVADRDEQRGEKEHEWEHDEEHQDVQNNDGEEIGSQEESEQSDKQNQKDDTHGMRGEGEDEIVNGDTNAVCKLQVEAAKVTSASEQTGEPEERTATERQKLVLQACSERERELRWPHRAVRRSLSFLPLASALPTLASAAAANRDWTAAVRGLHEEDPDVWGRLAGLKFPGLSDVLEDGQSLPSVLRGLMRRRDPPRVPPSDSLSQWCFAVEVRRGERKLWSAALGMTHILHGFVLTTTSTTVDSTASADAISVRGGDESRDNESSTWPPPPWPNCYERLDVVSSGDRRRLAVAGAIAAMAAAAEAGVCAEDHEARLIVIHAPSGRQADLPTMLLPGCRRDRQSPRQRAVVAGTPLPTRQPLCVAVGLGASHVLPGPRAVYPAGSLEVRTSLAFIGPDGDWLRGGDLALLALLEAAVSWSVIT